MVKQYTVAKREVWISFVNIEAESEAKAIEKVFKGGGEEIEGGLEYSHTMGTEYWTAEVID